MTPLERIIILGNSNWHRTGEYKFRDKENIVHCADGFTMSVLAGGGAYCDPRPPLCLGRDMHPVTEDGVICTFPGPYKRVEVGYPSERPEPWNIWQDFAENPDHPTETVYGYVPVSLVRSLAIIHGGEIDE